jgi:hypothetical protein
MLSPAMAKILPALLALAVVWVTHPPGAAQSAKPRGAIAYSSSTGAFGYAVDQASKRSAEAEAFRQCGGDCDVIKTFSNGCGAIADGERHYAWDSGASREVAEMKARKKCGGASCKIAVWACTRGK